MSRYIKSEKARALAYSWHGGQFSPLYAFASSGLVEDHNELLRDIERCQMLAGTTRDCRDLRGLYRFTQSCLARVPGKYPFVAPWGIV